jgi:hypothetical protein
MIIAVTTEESQVRESRLEALLLEELGDPAPPVEVVPAALLVLLVPTAADEGMALALLPMWMDAALTPECLVVGSAPNVLLLFGSTRS